ncbi:MAG: helix-turn-helix domain-containing protein [Verrucomicrobiota bacterium]|nr:helix-turn-helix domain-containing protein [Verrucomicrobiota bacterium]
MSTQKNNKKQEDLPFQWGEEPLKEIKNIVNDKDVNNVSEKETNLSVQDENSNNAGLQVKSEDLAPYNVNHQSVDEKAIQSSNIQGSLGEILIKARTVANLTIHQVVQKTKIQKQFIVALEEEAFNKLPSPVYSRSYIKNLCKLYKLEYGTLVREYDEIVGFKEKTHIEKKDDVKKSSVSLSSTTELGVKKTSYKLIITTILILFLVLIISFFLNYTPLKKLLSNEKTPEKTPEKQKISRTPSSEELKTLLKFVDEPELKKQILNVPQTEPPRKNYNE